MPEGTEFGALATLSVQLDERSVAEARADLEESLDDVSVTVGTDTGPAAVADGGGGSGMAALDGVGDELSEQTEILEEIRDEVETGGIGAGGTDDSGLPIIGGGGGGSGFLSGLGLAKFANLLKGKGTSGGLGRIGGGLTSLALTSMVTGWGQSGDKVDENWEPGPGAQALSKWGMNWDPLGGGNLFGGGSKLPGGGEGGPIFGGGPIGGGGPIFGGGPWLANSPAETTGIMGGGNLFGGGPAFGGGPLFGGGNLFGSGNTASGKEQADEVKDQIEIVSEEPGWVSKLLDGMSTFEEGEGEWVTTLDDAASTLGSDMLGWVATLDTDVDSLDDETQPWISELDDATKFELESGIQSGIEEGEEGVQENKPVDIAEQDNSSDPPMADLTGPTDTGSGGDGQQTETQSRRESKPRQQQARPNQAREGPSQPSQTNVTVNNEIKPQFELRNMRELKRFLRNPERFVNDAVDAGRIG